MLHSILGFASGFVSGFDSLSLIWAAGGVLILAVGIVVLSTLRAQSHTESELAESPLIVPPQPDTTQQ
jgi:hypothetical protein